MLKAIELWNLRQSRTGSHTSDADPDLFHSVSGSSPILCGAVSESRQSPSAELAAMQSFEDDAPTPVDMMSSEDVRDITSAVERRVSFPRRVHSESVGSAVDHSPSDELPKMQRRPHSVSVGTALHDWGSSPDEPPDSSSPSMPLFRLGSSSSRALKISGADGVTPELKPAREGIRSSLDVFGGLDGLNPRVKQFHRSPTLSARDLSSVGGAGFGSNAAGMRWSGGIAVEPISIAGMRERLRSMTATAIASPPTLAPSIILPAVSEDMPEISDADLTSGPTQSVPNRLRIQSQVSNRFDRSFSEGQSPTGSGDVVGSPLDASSSVHSDPLDGSRPRSKHKAFTVGTRRSFEYSDAVSSVGDEVMSVLSGNRSRIQSGDAASLASGPGRSSSRRFPVGDDNGTNSGRKHRKGRKYDLLEFALSQCELLNVPQGTLLLSTQARAPVRPQSTRCLICARMVELGSAFDIDEHADADGYGDGDGSGLKHPRPTTCEHNTLAGVDGAIDSSDRQMLLLLHGSVIVDVSTVESTEPALLPETAASPGHHRTLSSGSVDDFPFRRGSASSAAGDNSTLSSEQITVDAMAGPIAFGLETLLLNRKHRAAVIAAEPAFVLRLSPDKYSRLVRLAPSIREGVCVLLFSSGSPFTTVYVCSCSHVLCVLH